MKKAVKYSFVILLLFCCCVFTSVYIMSESVSENYKINRGEELQIDAFVPITVSYEGAKKSQNSPIRKVGEKFEADLKIFGVIPFSTVNIEIVDHMYVSVLGTPFGMKVYTDGVLVIESTDIVTERGKVNPALDAGIKVGDYIKTVNGQVVNCNEDVLQLVTNSNGGVLSLEVVRDGKSFTCNVTPALDKESNTYRIGIWVRDSTAGIGTLTFYSPYNNVVCGLGHGICDSDTETLIDVNQGEFVKAEIISVEKGSKGLPGALRGKLTYNTIADISYNCERGVFGVVDKELDSSNLTEIALKQEVAEGKAQILCTVSGSEPKLYDCEIKRTNDIKSKTQNLVVTITDKELINITGGIVQGMSGSPLLQNGKLIGAVTHVLVDDPTKGYAIFAENMLETAQSVAEGQQIKEAS